ncbi:MAG: DUF2283 domain-containing protein [Methanobrevibacter sp.]|nr:DUF2283 domain-containing protein [Methanobrevibacter sp.]
MDKNVMLFHYDYDEDILFFYSKEKHEYDVSEFLTNLIVLDFDENKFPIGIEILHASEVLNTEKHFLKNIENGEIAIEINEDKIKLKLSLIISVYQKDTTLPISVIGANKSQIPSIQTEIALTTT